MVRFVCLANADDLLLLLVKNSAYHLIETPFVKPTCTASFSHQFLTFATWMPPCMDWPVLLGRLIEVVGYPQGLPNRWTEHSILPLSTCGIKKCLTIFNLLIYRENCIRPCIYNSFALQSRTGKYRGLQRNPCNENRIPAMRAGFPVMKTGFFLWELTYRVWVYSVVFGYKFNAFKSDLDHWFRRPHNFWTQIRNFGHCVPSKSFLESNFVPFASPPLLLKVWVN